MNRDFVQKVQEILVLEKDSILSKPKTSEEVNIDFDGDETDEVQANLIAAITTHLSLLERDKLIKIEEALSKIRNGSFGECEECGNDISEKRLLINPSFSTCIVCAEQIERDRKINRGI